MLCQLSHTHTHTYIQSLPLNGDVCIWSDFVVVIEVGMGMGKYMYILGINSWFSSHFIGKFSVAKCMISAGMIHTSHRRNVSLYTERTGIDVCMCYAIVRTIII